LKIVVLPISRQLVQGRRKSYVKPIKPKTAIVSITEQIVGVHIGSQDVGSNNGAFTRSIIILISPERTGLC